MACDVCGRETSPGESICWQCVEDISRNNCDRCALGDRADGHNICDDCLGEVHRNHEARLSAPTFVVVDEVHDDRVIDYARGLVSGTAVARLHLHGIPDAALEAGDEET